MAPGPVATIPPSSDACAWTALVLRLARTFVCISPTEPPIAIAPDPDASTFDDCARSRPVTAACSTAPKITRTPKATHSPHDECCVTKVVTTPTAAATTTDTPAVIARHMRSTPPRMPGSHHYSKWLPKKERAHRKRDWRL